MKTMIKRLWRDECGASALEYGLIASLIALGAAAGMSALGSGLGSFFTGLVARIATG